MLPPYQGQGHGRFLLESINSIATSDNLYDVTAEEPSEYLQNLRICTDSLRLLGFDPVTSAVTSATSHLQIVGSLKAQLAYPPHMAEQARDHLKINRKQFLKCWEVLLYLSLEKEDSKSFQKFKTWVSERVREEILGKDFNGKKKELVEVPNDYNQEMSFVVFISPDGSEGGSERKLEPEQEEQLEKVVDEQLEEIAEIARKVSLFRETKVSPL